VARYRLQGAAPQTSSLPGGSANITALPKVSLHDHLDGGHARRPSSTSLTRSGSSFPGRMEQRRHRGPGRLVRRSRTRIPRQVPQDLRRHHRRHADDRGTPRVARRFVETSGDGVIYGEIAGLPGNIWRAVSLLDGAVDGSAGPFIEVSTPWRSRAASGSGGWSRPCRHADRGLEIAELSQCGTAISVRVGFDIAGAEAREFPRPPDAFDYTSPLTASRRGCTQADGLRASVGRSSTAARCAGHRGGAPRRNITVDRS
jgi:adenosine deaminase